MNKRLLSFILLFAVSLAAADVMFPPISGTSGGGSSGGGGGGTVTSVSGGTTGITVATPTVTPTLGGTLNIANGGTGAATTSQNFAFIGPTSGSGAPSFRAIVPGDIPTLNQNTTGSAATATTAGALTSTPSACSLPQLALGIAANGNASCAQPSNVTGNAATATNVAGGAANSLPYQTNANTTAMLAQGTGVLQETAGAPGWTTTPTLTGTNFSGVPSTALTGTLQAAQMPALTGDVTNSAGSLVTTAAATQPNITTFTQPISFNGGVNVGTGGSTVPVSGLLFFISSNTVNGSTSTLASTSLVYFSTYTLLGNTLTAGHAVIVECAFINGSTVTGPVQSVQFGASTSFAGESFTTTANDWIRIRVTHTLNQTGQVEPYIEGQHNNGNTNGGSINVAQATGSTTVGWPFDATQPQTFYCAASRSSGGSINFQWMKVSIL